MVSRDEAKRFLEIQLGIRSLGVKRTDPASQLRFESMPLELPKTGPFDPFQELLRNDLVGVDVGAIQRGHDAGVFGKALHDSSSARARSVGSV